MFERCNDIKECFNKDNKNMCSSCSRCKAAELTEQNKDNLKDHFKQWDSIFNDNLNCKED